MKESFKSPFHYLIVFRLKCCAHVTFIYFLTVIETFICLNYTINIYPCQVKIKIIFGAKYNFTEFSCNFFSKTIDNLSFFCYNIHSGWYVLNLLKLFGDFNMRYSKQRELILNAVLNNKVHPTADFVYNFLKEDNPELSLGTVYRNLNFLAENNMLKKSVC